MDTTSEVIRAAEARAQALASGDADRLRELLHSDFRWVSHAGERYDRDSYVASNVEATSGWTEQRLTDISVIAHEQTAVLRCTVVDTIDGGHGPREYRMPMTQVWIRREGRWVCLAGHAGARL
jgi:ketosteroid isomerase-like protein